MAFFNWFEQLDASLFLSLNGWNNSFFDYFFSLFTSKEMWIPLYLVLIGVFIKKFQKNSFWVILFLLIAIVGADQISSLIKFWVERPRPTHNPAFVNIVHNTFVGPGGSYGFVSSHAANAFALYAFVNRVFKQRSITIILLVWALLTAYSRVYVGVHYPLDLICGGILGWFFGWGAYHLMIKVDVNYGRKDIFAARFDSQKDQTQVISYVILFSITTMLVASYVLLKCHILP